MDWLINRAISEEMMVRLRKFLATDRSAVLGLAVTEGQAAFVEPLAETLSSAAPQRDNFVIEANGVVVGFFQIDSSSGMQKITNTLELHEVSIDAKHQGKGYGKAFTCTLKSFLQSEYPEWVAVCLTVNRANMSAYRLYQLGGFADTGELHLQGRSGPQHIMRLSLS